MRLEGLFVGEGRVLAEHIDYNGHMNVVHYRAAFDLSTDGLFAHLGLAPDVYNVRTGATLMVVEEHTRYHAELAEGERYRILARLVSHSAKKLHYLLAMENLDREILAATHEELAFTSTWRPAAPAPCPWPPWPPSRPWRPPRPTSRPHPTWAGSSPPEAGRVSRCGGARRPGGAAGAGRRRPCPGCS